MKAHGVPWLIRHLRGEIPLDEAAAGGIMDTRRYAKRQLTWFRNQMKDWPWVDAEAALGEITATRRLMCGSGGGSRPGGIGHERRWTFFSPCEKSIWDNKID